MHTLGPLLILLLSLPGLALWRALLVTPDHWSMGRAIPAPRRPELIDSFVEINPTFNDWRGFA